MDFKKAYDCMPRSRIFRVLRKHAEERDVEGEMQLLQRLEEIYKDTTLCYDAAKVVVTQGIPQGSKLGPIMFATYLHRALQSSPLLKTAADNGRIMAFADDLGVMCFEEAEVAAIIAEVQALEAEWFLKVNLKKSQILIAPRLEAKFSQRTTTANIAGVEVVLCIKYLGHDIYNARDKSTKRLLSQCAAIAARTHNLKSLGVHCEARTMISKQLVKSVIMYLLAPFYAARYVTNQ